MGQLSLKPAAEIDVIADDAPYQYKYTQDPAFVDVVSGLGRMRASSSELLTSRLPLP